MLNTALEDGVLTLTLDRPDRLNALTVGLQRDLHHALQDAARDPGVKVVVLTGAGRGFCAGFDVRDGVEGMNDDPIAARWSGEPVWNELEHVAGRLRHDAEIPYLLHTMPKVTIAMVRGPAAGSGMVLAAACDLRIAGESALFKTAFSSLGRCGDPGGSYLISKLVGPAKARELYLLDEKVGAAEARQIGLVNRVVPDDRLEAETYELARRLAVGPGAAFGYIKRNMNASETMSFEEVLGLESYANARASSTHDAKEAAMAFMEKRAPKFRGY
jgi:2-(1,2-epoxy-1,2-dihydrophenyl)acetyl-CoA isomerase